MPSAVESSSGLSPDEASTPGRDSLVDEPHTVTLLSIKSAPASERAIPLSPCIESNHAIGWSARAWSCFDGGGGKTRLGETKKETLSPLSLK